MLQIRAGQQSITANTWPLTTHIYHVMIMVTGGFSKKSFLLIFSEAALRRCSSKQVLLEISQYSQENIMACNFISTSSQKRLQHRFFPVNIAKNFMDSFFYRTPPVAAFVSLIKYWRFCFVYKGYLFLFILKNITKYILITEPSSLLTFYLKNWRQEIPLQQTFFVSFQCIKIGPVK